MLLIGHVTFRGHLFKRSIYFTQLFTFHLKDLILDLISVQFLEKLVIFI